MTYTVDDTQRLFNLLGQVVWYTQHLELVMTQYNTLLNLQVDHQVGTWNSKDEIRNVLSRREKETLEPLIAVATQQGSLPERLRDRFRFFIKTRSWILHDCVNDPRLSFKDAKSQDFFFDILEEYLKEAKALKAEIFREMEIWLTKNGYNLDQVYPLSGEFPEDRF